MDQGHEGGQKAAIETTEHELDINMTGQDGAAQQSDDADMDDAQIEQQVVTGVQIDVDHEHETDTEPVPDDHDQPQYETNVDGMQIEQEDVPDAQAEEDYEQDDTELMHDDESQEHDETNVDGMATEQVDTTNAQIEEDYDQETEMEPVPNAQNQSSADFQAHMDQSNDYDEASVQDVHFNFQPTFFEDEPVQDAPLNGGTVQEEPARRRQSREDSSSLFVPEDSPRPPASRVPLRRKPPHMGPPARPVAHPSSAAQSMFSKIRNMQKATSDRKNAAHKRASTPRYTAEPDNEAYLEAVMAPITPSSSTAVPKVNEDVMEDRKASAEFERQKKIYQDLKRKNGSLTFRQDVEWMKIKGADDARKNKQVRDQAKARQEAEGDTELFPSANPTFDEDQEDGEDNSGDDFGFNPSGSRKRQRREMPRKEPKQMSMQEAELQSMKVALEAHEDAPRKKRKNQPTDDDSQDIRASSKGKGKAANPRGRPKGSKSAPKKAASGPRKTAKSRREADHALKQASSLFGANVFEQQAGEHEREQPTFSSRKKQDALKELIASVPIEDKKQARSDMAGLLAATKEFDGHGAVKAVAGGWLVKGMKTSLKGYQVLGSAFMRKRENAAEEPLGGLMADQMGLGKTLMMLANIVNGQPPKGVYPRTTLLVASPSLLSQWSSEIEQHTKCGLKIMRYGAGNRLHSSHWKQILDQHDIILTTYAEVMRSYPKNEPPIECQTAEQKIAWWKDVFETHRGILHRMRWLRIVLDEAQAIKNHTGRTSIACRALIAKHRWALSGTPIMNSLTELYPYFKFLGVPHTGSFKIFKHNYCDTKDTENTERLLVRLSQFMIRRTHADRMFNAPILKLPQADQATYWCEFNPVERTIYDIVKERFTKTINMWQANGTLEKSYSNALVMLLRLRQLTAHVLMLQFVMRDLLELEDLERIKEVVKEHAADSTGRRGGTIIAIRKQLEQHAIREKQKAAERAAAKAAGKEFDEEEEEETPPEEAQSQDQEPDEPASQTTGQEGAGRGGSGKNFGKDYNFKPFLASLKTGDSWEKAKKRAKCSYCDKTPREPWIAECGHLICVEPCLEESNLEAAEVGKMSSPCKTCGKTPRSIQPCMLDDVDPIEAVAQGTRSKKATKSAEQKERRDREDISEDWLSLAGADVLPSAKTLAIKAQILNWRKENPEVKIIIYTQFLAMVRILGKICQHEGWQAEQYIGTMSFSARDKAIVTFANNPNCNILLASLRCGGLGLNLTMASRVIMMDPWWNSASEQQAFCRVFRIGQNNETYMSRLCVRNSVDAHLIAMQERKQKEINGVMEEDISRVKKMSIADLMRLFGNLEEDEDGKQFIMVDNPDPRGGFRADRDDEGYADDF